jgi:hypothetical protein
MKAMLQWLLVQITWIFQLDCASLRTRSNERAVITLESFGH